MHDDEWFPLQELTQRLGGLVWVERRLAELASEWSRIDASAPAAVAFAALGGHHAWHAEIINQCLPTSPALAAGEVIEAPTAGWQRAVDTLRTLDAPDATTTRLKALVRVVDPWLARELGALTELANPVSDAAMTRWLRFAMLDHHDDGDATIRLLTNRSGEAVTLDEHAVLSELDLS